MSIEKVIIPEELKVLANSERGLEDIGDKLQAAADWWAGSAPFFATLAATTKTTQIDDFVVLIISMLLPAAAGTAQEIEAIANTIKNGALTPEQKAEAVQTAIKEISNATDALQLFFLTLLMKKIGG